MTKGEWRGFYALQTLRLLSLLTTMAILVIYLFIYMRKAFIYYSFWALLFTFLAFLFLLIGFGKQVVYHQLRKQGKITVERRGRSIQWQIGVFFYSIALPFCITANIINFYNFTHVHKTNALGENADDVTSKITKYARKFFP